LPAAPEADFSALAARGRLAGSGLSRAGRWSISLSLVPAAFAADYLTGDEVSSSLFYVLAVAAGAWLLGRRPGLLLALLSTAAWEISYELVGIRFSSRTVLFWNLAAELGIYVTLALALARLRLGLEQERLLTTRLHE